MKKVIFLVVFLFISLVAYLVYASSFPLPVYVAEKIQEFREYQEVKVTPLLFVGDIMLGRYVENLKNKEGLDPFGDTTNFLKAHLTIANLEGPIPKIHKPTPSNGFSFSFASSTGKNIKDHGIQVVSLSNNHSLDQGVSGYENTKAVLDKEGVSHFGGYTSRELDYFETKLGTTTVIIFGINTISTTWKEQTMLDFVTFLRGKYPSAYLISFIHWGNEYTLKQGESQRELAYKLIDKGVNVIVGSHPHVVEGVEIYKNAPIFYSLGNFIFDQYFSEETQEGYLLAIDKQKGDYIFSFTPVVSKQSKTDIANEGMSKKILETILQSSDQNLHKSIKEGKIVLPIL